MDFTLTDDQQLLRDTARKLLDRECPPAVVRAHIDDPAAYVPLWTHLSEYTALGLGPATDLCLFLEETGKVAAPGPFLATVLFASLTGEEATGTVAIAGASGAWEPNADPVKTFVLEADRVDRVAIVGAGPTLSVIDAPPALRAAVRHDRRLLAAHLRARHGRGRARSRSRFPRRRSRRGSTARTCRSRPRWSAPRAASSR